jgi:hypothetical protein
MSHFLMQVILQNEKSERSLEVYKVYWKLPQFKATCTLWKKVKFALSGMQVSGVSELKAIS